MSTSSDTVKKVQKKGKEESGGVGEFVRETRAEWDKTTFPSSDDVRNTTLIVIVSVIFFTIYLFLVDKVWVLALDALTGAVNWLAGV
ncbi:MAG: preprotein translocase subunit SecE [Aridibacter famidurans]|nr:preprotein translocase subunit SecE [Aridibacter famidurans]QQS43032.1 MAG: preprotein translocase subunit SecE [Acidobacteriota bacterium]